MRGRNSTLLQNRNRKLIIRYYYWHDVKRIRRDDVISILSNEEFHLQPYTINCIIRENTELIKKLRKEKPEPKKLELYSFATN